MKHGTLQPTGFGIFGMVNHHQVVDESHGQIRPQNQSLLLLGVGQRRVTVRRVQVNLDPAATWALDWAPAFPAFPQLLDMLTLNARLK